MDVSMMTLTSAIPTDAAPAAPIQAPRSRTLSRRTIVSSGWGFSLGFHAIVIVAMSFCYFRQMVIHPPEAPAATVLDVQFVSAAAPEGETVPAIPPPEETPPGAVAEWVVEAISQCSQPEETPVANLSLEDVPVSPLPVVVKPVDAPQVNVAPTQVRFNPRTALKLAMKLQPMADAGGARQGSGGATKIVATQTGSGAAGQGGEGNGAGVGTGSGSGAGNRAGNGNAASGKGWGNGSGDGVGSGHARGIAGGGGSKPPRVRSLAMAYYPSEAKRAGIEGTVKVRMDVKPDGTIGSVQVAVSSGNASLDEAACAAARQCSIEPQVEDGEPVACSFILPYRFTLTSR